MTSPVPTPRGQNRLPAVVVVILALVVLGGAVYGGYTFAFAESPAVAEPDASPERLHVTDLMAKANCVGGVIGTQLHSYETGRCRLAGVEVTIAVFETGELRDQWLASARQFSNTLVAGVGWAAGMDKPDAAPILVAMLDGRVV